MHDQIFLPLIEPWVGETIVLADSGFAAAVRTPPDLKLCWRDTWNELMLVEATLSLMTMVCRVKFVFHRMPRCYAARLAYVVAQLNNVLALNRSL